ncbi:MAG TPA: helix-turn-helix transcriptional regulator [Phycisphaerae bacterium]|nr:helix-turn-helix transcriptional regulator [Phycisphaerae bacterium]
MSIIEKITEMKQHQGKRDDALNTITAIAQMDPHAREDLIIYLEAFNKAQAAGDEDEQNYLVKAIIELFDIGGDDGESSDLDKWEQEIKSSSKGRGAYKKLQDETNRFFKVYQRQKARCGLMTIRSVAEAAHLSPTTIQAIEKQRVKPQFKTIQALSKAFGIEPELFIQE